jgi:YD repeat-containing protein
MDSARPRPGVPPAVRSEIPVPLDPAPSPTSRPGRRRRRFRPARCWLAIVASLSVLAGQLAGEPVTPASAAAAPVSFTYDAAGRLASVTTAAGTANYQYDAEGNLLSITSPAAPSHAVRSPGAATPAPSISSAGPPVAAPGKKITITGHGFATAKVKDVVRIGALAAPVTTASASRLVVIAPPGNGGAVAVTTPGGTARGPEVKITQPPAQETPAQGRDAHPLRAAAGITALSGLVENDQGHPLAGIQISVASPGGHQQATTRTGADGQFLITHLAPAGTS